MVYLYNGTPGGGKGYHATARIVEVLKHTNVNVMCSYPIDVKQIFLTRLGYLKRQITKRFPKIKFKKYNSKEPKSRGSFTRFDINTVTVDYFKEYCEQYHVHKEVEIDGEIDIAVPEDQTLVIFDEAHRRFNCRTWNDKSRQEWCTFFAEHRHYGFNIILISQHEKMLDKQICYQIEMYVNHKNLKYSNWLGKIAAFLCGGSCFVYLYRWQGMNEIISKEFGRYTSRIGAIYNSFKLYDKPPAKADTAGGRSANAEGPTDRAANAGEEVTNDGLEVDAAS